MKLVSAVLSMFCLVLFTIMTACDSATGNGSVEDQDTIDPCPSGNCSTDSAVGGDAPFELPPADAKALADKQGDNSSTGYCGDGVCGTFEGDTPENCLNCLEDCPCSLGLVCNDVGVCAEDPLADYYWLEGQWQCESVDGNPCITGIVDVTVEAWDIDLGAEVHGFSPITVSHIKKKAETNEFILFVEYDSSTYANGLADQSTLTLEFDFCTPCSHNIYKKL